MGNHDEALFRDASDFNPHARGAIDYTRRRMLPHWWSSSEKKNRWKWLKGLPLRMNEGRFSVDLTATGRAHSALSGLSGELRLPPVLSFWAPVKSSELSSVLIATADASPVLVVRRYGQGRVAMVLSDSLWRWQMGGADDVGEKSVYSRFITQLVYWLAPSEKEVEKTTMLQALVTKSEVELRERVTIGAVYDVGGEKGNDTLSCRITTPEGRRMTFPMVSAALGPEVGLNRKVNGYKCVFSPKQPGQYKVVISTPDGSQEAELLLLAKRSEHERTGAAIDRQYLHKMSADTGGKFVQWKQRTAMFKDIPWNAKEVQLVEEYPVWNRWWWLVLLIALFAGEWWWRRQLDLV